jgi:hypothetical protein
MSDSFSELYSSDAVGQRDEEKKRRKRKYNKKYYQKLKKFRVESSSGSTSDYEPHEALCDNKVVKNHFKNISVDYFRNDHFDILTHENSSMEQTEKKECYHTNSPDTSFSHESETHGTTDSSHDSTSSDDSKESFEPLYRDCNISVLEFLLTMQTLKIKHNLSDNTINDFLKAIQAVLPKGNKVPKNLNNLEKKLIREDDGDHYKICSMCHKLKHAGTIKSLKIENENCETCNRLLISFVTFNIRNQLKNILSQKSHLRQIIENNKEARINSPVVHSAISGKIYQNALTKIDKNELVLSFNINTDGAPLTNSKNFSMWPLMGSILELNTKTREKFTNLIFFGMWLSVEKPVYNIFFEKSTDKLFQITKSGFKIEDFKFDVRVQMFVADLPAKAAALNIKQFNGDFGCIKCLHPGEWNRAFHKMTYPPLETSLRDARSFQRMASVAEKSNTIVFGIKGKSSFSRILTLPDQIPFDYMHLVLQGHTKWLINHYFIENQYDCYIGHEKITFNKLLNSHTVPHNISRKFPHVEKNLKFKSTELKLFLFHLAAPMLMNILPIEYWCLLFTYVYSIRSIYEPFEKSSLKVIEDMIKFYHSSLNNYFGNGAYDYSIHAHLHLTSQVLDHGPLYCHSQFVFEGALGNLKKRLKGTRGYLTQVVRKIFYHTNLDDKVDEKKMVIMNDLFGAKANVVKDTLLGPFKKRYLKNDEKILFQAANIKIDETILASARCILDYEVYHSKKYDRRGNSNSYTICFYYENQENFGEIEEFFRYGASLLCKVKMFELNETFELPSIPREFQQYVNLVNFGKFFKCFSEEKYNYTIIECKNIVCKALKIKNLRTCLNFTIAKKKFLLINQQSH